MIRVALSTSVVQRGKSGVASYLFGLLGGLHRSDTAPELVLLGLDEDKPLFEKWLDRCQWVPVGEEYRPALKNVLWHQTVLRGVLRREKIDVLHIPSYRRIVARPPVPQVVTIHDLASFAVRGKYDLARMIYGKKIVRLLARQADTVTTVSHATARDVHRYFGLPEAALHVIWNGIDHDAFRPLPSEEVRAGMARLEQRAPYFIYLARLEHPGKNHVRLIEAFEQFCQANPADSHDLVFGGADWHGADVIHKRISDSPVKHRIRSLGFVAKDDLPLWYSGATALIYPSLFEGFGLPPVEAMACGVPVISSTCGSLGEVVGEAARLIDPYDPRSIAAAMAEIALNPETAGLHRRLGLERAGLFSWDRAAASVCALYKQAAVT